MSLIRFVPSIHKRSVRARSWPHLTRFDQVHCARPNRQCTYFSSQNLYPNGLRADAHDRVRVKFTNFRVAIMTSLTATVRRNESEGRPSGGSAGGLVLFPPVRSGDVVHLGGRKGSKRQTEEYVRGWVCADANATPAFSTLIGHNKPRWRHGRDYAPARVRNYVCGVAPKRNFI